MTATITRTEGLAAVLAHPSFWFVLAAVTVVPLVCAWLDRRPERRKRPMLTSDYLAPWTNRAPGEMPEVER